MGVVTEAFAEQALEPLLGWLQREVPAVTDLEVGCGGYAPTTHCDMPLLLRDGSARETWRRLIADHGLSVAALNAWGNPLHPDDAVREKHASDLRDAVRLAALLGIDRLVALAGCPAGSVHDTTPNFPVGGWVPYLEGRYGDEWPRISEFWSELAEFAQREHPSLRICIELHPGTVVYNVETFERVSALSPAIAATLDPSHFFWTRIDPMRVIERLGPRIAHAHAKDTSFNESELALNGLLDHRWPSPPDEMPWNFSVAGRGHPATWWHDLLAALEQTSTQSVSIEHEDPFVQPADGVREAAAVLDPEVARR